MSVQPDSKAQHDMISITKNSARPPAPSALDDHLLDTQQVAKVFKCTAQWLERLRIEGRGPKYVKIGRLVRYRRSSVEAWIAEQEKASTKTEAVTG